MRYDTVIFDLDGTLLNTLEDLTDSVNMVLKNEGYAPRTKEDVREFIGNGVKMLMERSLPPGTTEEEVLRCLSLFRPVYLKNMQNKTKPYDGIPAVLEKLKEMGVKVGVVSNKPHEATQEICRQYFHGNIDAAIGDNADRRNKPDPDNVYEALKQLGAEKDRTLYAGDSDIDMYTAQNAGLDSVGVTWGYRSLETLAEAGADYIIDEPERLIDLIK